MKTFVIGIAGPPGSGKSALIAALAIQAATTGNVAVVQFDGFPTPSDHLSPQAMQGWLARGADFAALPVDGLVEALTRLRAGEAIIEPVSRRPVRPAPLILFEMPLGRAHAAGQAIDHLVWLDTPLDVALARNLLHWESAGGQPPGWLGGYARAYLDAIRAVLTAQRAAVRPGADQILSGMEPPAPAAQAVWTSLNSRGVAPKPLP